MKLKYNTDLGELWYGNVSELKDFLVPETVDLIFTDPPYPKQHLSCFQELSELAPYVLKDGGSLITLLGHYQLERVMMFFHDKLKYRWILNLDQENDAHARMAMGIEVCWKPLLWYVKNRFPKERHYGFLRDKVESKQREKTYHVWQQSLDWSTYYITKLTKERELVLDPFCGGGTFPLACEMSNRRWIAVDNSEQGIQATINRFEEYKNVSLES